MGHVFYPYGVGIVSMSVCTNIESTEEIERLANEKHPTGIDSKWTISSKPFNSGELNPCPCNEHPDSRKHYLLTC